MPAPPTNLETRPDATAYQIDDLLGAVSRGRIRLPRFQRTFRWGTRDRIELFDSLLRGYPIGTLLLWKRPAPAETLDIGRFHLDAPAMTDALWVVDGQQRLTTLVDDLLSADKGVRSRIVYHLVEEKFYFSNAPRADEVAPPLLPLAVVLDAKQLSRWCTRADLPDREFDQALELGKRLREYRVPAYVIETNDTNAVRDIFDRTNRTGKRLDAVEVFDALFGAFEPEDEDHLGSLEQSEAARAFGGLDRDVLMQCLLTIAELPLDREFARLLKERREKLPELVAKTKVALARAVHFLREEAKIPNASLLPYSLPLPVLVRFFALFPEPHTRHLRLLRRWLWRGIGAMSLAGSSVGLRTHIEAVRHGEEAGSVQRLLSLASQPMNPSMMDLSEFRANTARSRAQLCAMAALKPRELGSDDPVFMGERESVTLQLTVIPGEEGRGLVSRFFLVLPPTKMLLFRLQHERSGEVLASHSLDETARQALVAGRLDEFFAARRRNLVTQVDAFLRGLTEYGADDSPPLSAILAEEEEEP